MSLIYAFKSASRSLAKEKWINLLSVFTVASSLLMLIFVFLFLYNTHVLVQKLPERFSMVVYLKNNITQEATQALFEEFKQRKDIEIAKYNSKENAMDELKHKLGTSRFLLDGLEENPLSSSFELKLTQQAALTQSTVRKIYNEVMKMPGVDDVYYGEKVVSAFHLVQRSIQNSSVIIFFAIAFGVIFVIYSTVKILFYRRTDEIETLKLLGATRSFIRQPFLIEGGIIGLMGGGLGVLGAFVFYIGITYRLSSVIPLLNKLAFPLEMLALLPLAGLVLGIIGSAIAIGRLKL
ncbi:MAG: permease-like cell division protein FtsX [Dissulfurispiraceae bacterium]|jgi:cell division transport system permease protein|nr:permease-like cell division protein FtsX [Dissulfurispiraceae bacterium]